MLVYCRLDRDVDRVMFHREDLGCDFSVALLGLLVITRRTKSTSVSRPSSFIHSDCSSGCGVTKFYEFVKYSMHAFVIGLQCSY